MEKNKEKTRGWVCRTASLFELPGPSVVSLRNLRPAHPSRRLYTLRRIYSCSFCRNHNAYHDDIISKARPRNPTLIFPTPPPPPATFFSVVSTGR